MATGMKNAPQKNRFAKGLVSQENGANFMTILAL